MGPVSKSHSNFSVYNLRKRYVFPIVILVWEFTKSIVLCWKLFLYAVYLITSSVITIVNGQYFVSYILNKGT